MPDINLAPLATDAPPYRAMRLELRNGELAYWTVLDGDWVRVPVVDEFLFSTVRSGRAENTCRAYAHDIVTFLRWAASVQRPWMSARSLDDFQAWLLVQPTSSGRPRAVRTVNRQLTCVRGLLRFCVEAGYLSRREFLGLYRGGADYRFLPSEVRGERPAATERVAVRHRVADAFNAAAPKVIGEQDYVAMLKAASCHRNRLLMALLHDCGLRVGEALGLWRGDMHLVEGSTERCSIEGPHVHVRRRLNVNDAIAKSRTPRWVPSTTEVVGWYGLYLRERDALPARSPTQRLLFVNLHQQAGKPMRYRSTYEMVVRSARKAGIPHGVTPHTLRHCYGTALSEAGAPRDVIAALMGHASHTSADVYLHPSEDRLRAAVAGMMTRRRAMSEASA